MGEPSLGEETGLSRRRPPSSSRERGDRGGRGGGWGGGESTRGGRAPGPATWRGRVSLPGRTSSSRAGVPRAASAPARVAGQVAQHLLIQSPYPESAEPGTGRTLGVRASGKVAAFPLPGPLRDAFPRNIPRFPEAGRRVYPEHEPGPSSCTWRLAMAPLPTSPGREAQAPAGAQLFFESEDGLYPLPTSATFARFPQSPSGRRGVSLDHRPP